MILYTAQYTEFADRLGVCIRLFPTPTDFALELTK